MRTLLFTFAILFSITAAQANVFTDNENTKKSETSKSEFYKSLVTQNGLHIVIKNTKEEQITTKKEFFRLLIQTNGLDNTKVNNN